MSHVASRPGDYPARCDIVRALYELVRDRGGRVDINPGFSDWTIFKELAGKLGVSEEHQRLVNDHGTKIWENDVRWARKTLVQAGVFLDEQESGRGIWQIAPREDWNITLLEREALPSEAMLRSNAVNQLTLQEFQACVGKPEALERMLEERIGRIRTASRWWNAVRNPRPRQHDSGERDTQKMSCNEPNVEVAEEDEIDEEEIENSTEEALCERLRVICQNDHRGEAETLFRTLTYREREIMKLLFGSSGGPVHSVEEIAHIFGESIEEIRLTELKALRKMLFPIRAVKLWRLDGSLLPVRIIAELYNRLQP